MIMPHQPRHAAADCVLTAGKPVPPQAENQANDQATNLIAANFHMILLLIQVDDRSKEHAV